MVVMGQSMGSKLWSLVVNGERISRGKERPGDMEEAETKREREKKRRQRADSGGWRSKGEKSKWGRETGRREGM
jgi:hypothetical protein